MIWLFALLAVVSTFVIAAVSIGSVTARLASLPRRTVYDVDQAVRWIGDHLPGEVTAQITYDDVRAVIECYLEFLAERGIASERTALELDDTLILVPDDERLARILGRLDELESEAPGSSLTDEQVASILEANTRYETLIGAVGAQVPN